jgi:molecular chaperone GrpE
MPEKMRPELAGTVQEAEALAVRTDLESLRQRIKGAEQERDDYLALVRRTRADFENYQKRIQREMAEDRRYAHAELARELLPVIDNLRRAVEAARRENDRSPLIDGVTMVHSQLLDVLRRYGVSPIEPGGELFDPTAHEAVVQKPRSDVAPGTIVEVFEPGYRLHERILRPAKVAVAVQPD